MSVTIGTSLINPDYSFAGIDFYVLNNTNTSLTLNTTKSIFGFAVSGITGTNSVGYGLGSLTGTNLRNGQYSLNQTNDTVLYDGTRSIIRSVGGTGTFNLQNRFPNLLNLNSRHTPSSTLILYMVPLANINDYGNNRIFIDGISWNNGDKVRFLGERAQLYYYDVAPFNGTINIDPNFTSKIFLINNGSNGEVFTTFLTEPAYCYNAGTILNLFNQNSQITKTATSLGSNFDLEAYANIPNLNLQRSNEQRLLIALSPGIRPIPSVNLRPLQGGLFFGGGGIDDPEYYNDRWKQWYGKNVYMIEDSRSVDLSIFDGRNITCYYIGAGGKAAPKGNTGTAVGGGKRFIAGSEGRVYGGIYSETKGYDDIILTTPLVKTMVEVYMLRVRDAVRGFITGLATVQAYAALLAYSTYTEYFGDIKFNNQDTTQVCYLAGGGGGAAGSPGGGAGAVGKIDITGSRWLHCNISSTGTEVFTEDKYLGIATSGSDGIGGSSYHGGNATLDTSFSPPVYRGGIGGDASLNIGGAPGRLINPYPGTISFIGGTGGKGGNGGRGETQGFQVYNTAPVKQNRNLCSDAEDGSYDPASVPRNSAKKGDTTSHFLFEAVTPDVPYMFLGQNLKDKEGYGDGRNGVDGLVGRYYGRGFPGAGGSGGRRHVQDIRQVGGITSVPENANGKTLKFFTGAAGGGGGQGADGGIGFNLEQDIPRMANWMGFNDPPFRNLGAPGQLNRYATENGCVIIVVD